MAIDEESGKGYPASWSLSAKPCDSCKSASALLFCRADSAFLCFNCDAKVHGANKLASRHERVWMCEVCEHAPASVTCKADAAVLCVTCDRDIHSANPLARRHERIPVVPFYESAASAMKSNVANLLVPDGLLKSSDEDDDRNDKEEDNDTCREEAEAASWLLPNPNPPKLMETPDLKSGDYFFSDVDPYLDLDYGSSMETRYHHQNSANADSVVPVHTKPPPPPLMNTSDRCFDMGFCRSKPSYGYTTPTLSQSVNPYLYKLQLKFTFSPNSFSLILVSRLSFPGIFVVVGRWSSARREQQRDLGYNESVRTERRSGCGRGESRSSAVVGDGP
uniref:B box-type domain-containing protein n=1 Tax=Nelumbo nucifera TaxID=4432 RepID=A0A822Y8W7_NELNU|nr:TPA_asm: hypothetical protein HUJ06_029104 [Nelumbo nucifera]